MSQTNGTQPGACGLGLVDHSWVLTAIQAPLRKHLGDEVEFGADQSLILLVLGRTSII